jgi:hypothetical protein
MGNSRPYFVWTHDGITKIDLSKAIRLKKYRTCETTLGEGIYQVNAVYPDNAANHIEGSGYYILAVGLSQEEATKYIDKLTAEITSNMRDTDGSPMIIETVSPESFRILKQKVKVLQCIVEEIQGGQL